MNEKTIVLHSKEKDPKQYRRYTIVAVLKGKEWHFGASICKRGEQFSKKVGVQIAMERANNTSLPIVECTRQKAYQYMKSSCVYFAYVQLSQLRMAKKKKLFQLFDENGWEDVLNGLELAKKKDGVWYRATFSNDNLAFPAKVVVKCDNKKQELIFDAQDAKQFINVTKAYYEFQ